MVILKKLQLGMNCGCFRVFFRGRRGGGGNIRTYPWFHHDIFVWHYQMRCPPPTVKDATCHIWIAKVSGWANWWKNWQAREPPGNVIKYVVFLLCNKFLYYSVTITKWFVIQVNVSIIWIAPSLSFFLSLHCWQLTQLINFFFFPIVKQILSSKFQNWDFTENLHSAIYNFN